MKISKIMCNQSPLDGFPVLGVEGYGGEQDGTSVLFSEVLHFKSKKEADVKYPNVPDYMKLHWGKYTPGSGWEIVLGCWSDKIQKGIPFSME